MTWLQRAARWREGRPWMTNAALCVVGVGLVLLAGQFVSENDHFTLGFSGVSGWSAWLYVAAIVIVLTQPVNRATFWLVIGFAIAMRGMTLFADPFLSSDIYRYVWDGIVQHAHINPYRYVPANAALKFLQGPHQDVYANINRRSYARTIYPPVAQMVYWCVTLVSPTVQAMKVAMFGFECVTVGALVWLLQRMGRRREEILLYAWCPLLVWEIGGSGHVDAVVMAFVALALVFRYKNSPVLTGLFLACAVLTKFYPLVLFPALWQRKDWKMPAVMVALAAGTYAIYSSVGKDVFGFFGGYAKEEGMDSGTRYFLLDFAHRLPALRDLPMAAYMVFCAAVLGGLSWWAWKKATVERAEVGSGTPVFLRVAMALALAMMLLFSPHYPWYVAWLAPFFVLAPNLPLLVYLMGLFYLLTTPLGDGSIARMFVLNEILYGALVVACLLQAVERRWGVWRGAGA